MLPNILLICFYVSIVSAVLLALASNEIQDLNSSKFVISETRPINVATHLNELRKTDGWGLPDVSTSYGTLFQYSLTKQDEHGLFLDYKVTAVGDDDLPDWLYWNQETHLLEGVAEREMIWETYNIQVTARYKYHNGTTKSFTEYFTIRVIDGNVIKNSNVLKQDSSSSNKLLYADLKPIECRPDAAVTKATVIIDADSSKLLPQERVNLLRRLCSFLKLPVQMVSMLPLGSKQVLDASALVAGPGDVRQQIHVNPLTVQWLVGCGNVYADQMPILVLLEISSRNGSMSSAIDHGVVGWYITNSKQNNFKTASRLKRQAYYSNPTATPMPSIVRPTNIPVPTQTITEMPDVDVPETRIVPTATMSTFPDIEVTQTFSEIPSFSAYPRESITDIQPTKSFAPDATRLVTESTFAKEQTDEKFPWRTEEIEPSISIFRTPTIPTATEKLPILTTGFKDQEISEIMMRSMVTDIVTATARATGRITSKMTKKPPKTAKPTTGAVLTEEPRPIGPTISIPIGRLEAIVGNLFQYKIPNETFVDKEDGGTENLQLLFLTLDDNTVPPNSWVKLNKTTQTLYGLPLDEHTGTHEFLLAAVDSKSKIAKMAFEIAVRSRHALQKINHEFSVTLDLEYQKFLYDVETRINVANKIAKAFGDSDASKMTVTRISEGSVEYAWTNHSIPIDPCPEEEIAALLKQFILPNGSINENFIKSIKPYRIVKANAETLGSCSHIVLQTGKVPPTPPSEVKQEKQKEGNLLVYIIITFIIVAVIILVLVIVCLVCCKKQRKLHEDQDKLDGLHKGIPIIFADELDERPDTPKSTLRSRRSDDDDKPISVPPPEYPRSKPGSQSSTLRSDYKEPLISDDEEVNTDDLDKTLPSTAKLTQDKNEPNNVNQSTSNPSRLS